MKKPFNILSSLRADQENGEVSASDLGQALFGQELDADASSNVFSNEVWLNSFWASSGANGAFAGRPNSASSSSKDSGAPFRASAVDAPAVTVAEGASAEISGLAAQPVEFTSRTGTLKIDHSIGYTGQISGLAGSDAIDLADVSYGVQTQVTYLGNTTGGTLTVTDGIHTANIDLQGDYLSSTWTLSSDGHGGTIVVDPVASQNWQTLKVGAGGAITGIDIAPDGTEVIRTDTYGAYLWNGSEWQQLVTASSMPASFVAANLGNTGQGVYEIQIASSNTNILYMMFDGDVFKSTNKGTTWTQTNFAQVTAIPNAGGSGMGEKMAIDPNNPNIVYVGSANGMFVTTDGGNTWASVGAIPAGISNYNGYGNYPTISGLLFDPAIGGVVNGVTQTIFASSSGNGVYQSTNGGTTWTSLSGGPAFVEDACVSSTGTYYASDGNSVWSYANGKWTNLFTVPNGQGCSTVAVNPTNPNEIICQAWAGYLYVSYDGGTTWAGSWASNEETSTDIPWLTAANSNGGGNFLDITHVTFNPLNPNQLVATGGTGVWNAANPSSSFSPSSTITWNDQSLGIEQLVANEIIVPPGGAPVLASWDRPFFYINNLNAYPSTYGPVASDNINAGWSVDYASSTPSFIVGLVDGGQGVYSTNGGQTWSNFATSPGVGNGGTIAASTPQNIIIAPADGVQPYYTLDGGQTWNPINLPGVTSWSNFEGAYYLDVRDVTADRVNPNTFYLYYPGQGVYETTNGGVSWTQVYSGNDGFGSQFNGYIVPFSVYNNELMSVPGEAGNLFFTGGAQGGDISQNAFMRSTNGGATWTAIPNVLNVSCFGFGAAAPGQSYPAIYIVGDVNGVYGVWQSINNAQSWTQIGTYPNGDLDTIKTISGDPNVFGQVYIGFMGSGYAVLEANSSAGPSVTGVTESPATGDLNAGKTVTLTLSLSSSVTVAGGTPTLTLNDGGVATFTGGSGTSALTFSYTVGASDTNVASLAATAVNLNGATINDGSGNAANLGLGGVTQTGPQIDTSTVISSISETPSSGDLNAGKTVTYTLTMNEAVTVNTTGGSPTLALNDGGTATYVGGSGTNALTFSYTVQAGQNTPDLMISSVNLNGAAVTDGGGNAANFSLSGISQGSPAVDTTPPNVSSVSATAGSYNSGKTLTLTLNLSEAVSVTGTPTLTLNDGGTATYTGGTGTSALTFSYTVGAGQNTAGLTVTAVNGTVTDLAGNALTTTNLPASFAGVVIDTTTPSVSSVVTSGTGITAGSGDLGVGSVVTLTVNMSEAVTVAGGTPTLTLNDGGTATYTGGSGSNALTFSYTVAAGQNTSDLAVTAVNLNSATVKNGAGTSATLTGAVTNPSGTLQISTTGPSVSSVVASGTGITSGSGDLAVGSVVTLTVNLSGTVTVAGGTPTLTLNDGGTATYAGGSGSNALTFSYTVAAGQNTADLAVTAVNLNSATVKDAAGNAANLTAAVTNPSGTLQIDTTTPSVSSVVASGTGITAGAGDLGVGSMVTLTVNMSEAVTVAGGSPTLALNDGGTATYTGGSGSNALTFSYTVAAGQSTSDLAVTAVNLNSATVKNGAGTAATLTGAVTNPSGMLQIDTTTPSVSSVVTSGTGITAGSGDLGVGSVVTLTVNLSEAVTVAGGTPTLTLNDGGTATYTGGSGSNALTFSYTVAAGQSTADLAVTAVNLNSATVKNGAGTAASLTGAVTNPSGTLQIDTTTPSVSSVVASGTGITSGSGDLGVGSVVTLTVNMSEAVTVAGGTPTLSLNDGGTATYTGGSGSNALTFSYTVAAGQNTSDLAVTAVNLNSATVKNGAGTAASLTGALTNPSGTLKIDTTTPSVSSVVTSGTGITSGSGDLGVGSVVTLTVNLSGTVTVAGGTPTLTLNDGGTATYTGGSGSNALTFSYTVAAGQNTSDLAVTAVNLNSAAVTGGAGAAANLTGAVTNPSGTLQIDTTTPTLNSITETPANGHLKAGKTVTLTLNMSEAVTVTGGTPTLTLNDGATATYTGGSGTSALTFSYTVAAGQNVSSLASTAINLNGATVKNGAGTAATFSTLSGLAQVGAQIDTITPAVTQVVASPGSGTENPGNVITLTLTLSEAVTVTGTPTLTLNDGGTATYTAGSGTNALTFSYTVGATDSTVPTLAIIQANLPSGATVTDVAGNAADLSGAVTTFPGLSIDPPPVVVSVAETPSSGDLGVGKTVTLTLTLNDVVTVSGGIPSLSLNDGGIATYVSGSGTNALTFRYTVGAGDNTVSLAATGLTLNGATIQNSLGDQAIFSFNGVTQTGPQIDTATPAVTSVAASGAGITAGSGDLPSGSVVTLTVDLSEAVTVAGGTPTLTLNDGGTATYSSGSGTNALTFTYTVAPGQNTADLAVTGFNAGTATIANGAGTAANMSGVAASISGTLEIDTATHVAQVGSNYFLDNVNNSGPELKYGGAPVTAGEFGAWTPIGAVQVAGGDYDVAWKNTATGQYTVWSTDSNGNYLSSLVGAVPGNSTAFESFETVFNQDLNGDGVIGLPPPTVIQTDGTTSLVTTSGDYFLNTTGSSSLGPELKYGGAAVTVGEFGSSWSPIGAVQIGGGDYDVAWKNTATSQYEVWVVDSNGNYLSNTGIVLGNNTTLEALETTFNQDLNGDGVIGLPPPTVIQTDGTTSLVTTGGDYFLNTTGSSSLGPELKYSGAAVTVGEFGPSWSPIGAVQIGGGDYDVAWKNTATSQYEVWVVDSNGNYLSNTGIVLGNNTTLEAIENNFNQDLNGDGIIGIYAAPGTTLQISSPLSGPSGSATIGAGATLELAAANASSVTFASSTGMLELDQPSAFDGVIFGFTGNGTLSGSDQIDLKDINFNNVHDSYSNGVLTVTDGTNTAALDFNGSYVLANFSFASDGKGGTILYDPPVTAGQQGNLQPEIMQDPGQSTLNQQVALFTQQIAAAFPTSSTGDTGGSVIGAVTSSAQLAQIASPVAATQQHA